MNAIEQKRERVVIYRLGSLGDTVVAVPCLHAVARAFPDAERIMLTNFPINAKAAPLEAILGGSGLVHRYVDYPLGTRSLRTLLALRRSLRALHATTLVYLTPSRGLATAYRDAVFFRSCGFRRLIGIPLSSDLQRNRPDGAGGIERECERLVRTLHVLGPIDLADPQAWDLGLTDLERAEAATVLQPLGQRPRIAINMGGKVVKNDWGVAKWTELFSALRATMGEHALVFVGSAEDHARAAAIAVEWPSPAANLCGLVTPRVSAAAMSGSRAFIGHDSGPLHLAASVGVPCVSMFGDNNPPRKWHPVGTSHRILHDMRGVDAITVQQVLAATLDVLGAKPGSRSDRRSLAAVA